jgi:hypothetical protein
MEMKNTIGCVSTQKQQITEEMNTDLDLNSSVELIFKTDYLPLDRMAAKGQVDRIKVNTINPDAEEKIASEERQARLQGARTADAARDKDLDTLLSPPAAQPAAPAPPAASGATPSTPAPSTPKPTGTATPRSAAKLSSPAPIAPAKPASVTVSTPAN